MKKHFFTGLFCLLCLTGFSQSINSQKSSIQFKVSNMAVNSVDGVFKVISGTVDFNPEQLAESRIKATIDVASIDTGIEKRDEHLRNEDFFYVEKFPEATFTSTNITAKGNGYIATGMLQLHGVTKEISIPFTFSKEGETTVLNGALTLNRKDFNIGEKFGGFMVGKKVSLQISCYVD